MTNLSQIYQVSSDSLRNVQESTALFSLPPFARYGTTLYTPNKTSYPFSFEKTMTKYIPEALGTTRQQRMTYTSRFDSVEPRLTAYAAYQLPLCQLRCICVRAICVDDLERRMYGQVLLVGRYIRIWVGDEILMVIVMSFVCNDGFIMGATVGGRIICPGEVCSCLDQPITSWRTTHYPTTLEWTPDYLFTTWRGCHLNLIYTINISL
jgi:hypothetical protein